jgi:hypothetical protein
MWKPKSSGSKWRWILQDLDRSFTGVDDELISKFTTSTSPSNYNWARIPLNSLLNNSGFSQQFAQRFTDHLYTTFHSRRVVSIIEKHKDLIDQEMPYHSARWAGTSSSYGNGIPSVSYWEGKVEELVEFANGRPSVMLQDIKNRFNLDDLVDLSVINSPSEGGQIMINQLPIPTTPWIGNYFKNMPFTLMANPAVGQDFLGWSTATYEPLITKGDEWSYLDDGSNQGETWKSIDFDDSSWKSGNAKFGYGDNNENTTISFGDDSSNKHITTYFRKNFTIEDVNTFTGNLVINLLRDDGALIYLNGKELLRSNLSAGVINYQTPAPNFASGEEESTYYSFIIDNSDLIEGENNISVEIHQNSPNSSDLGFDLEVQALKITYNSFISTALELPVNLNSDTIFVANYQESEICTLPRQISSNTTLDISCSPYYAISSVVVDSLVTLTIDEGVQILFPESASLKVKGKLLINGSEDLPVLFTSKDEDEIWGGIIFNYTSDISKLNYLEVSNASNGIHPIYENAAISAYHSTLEMDHITIKNVENNPILTYYSDVVLKNSTIHSKVTGDLINVKYGEGQVINSTFRGNNQIDTDAIDFDGVTNGQIVENKIFDFFGFNSDGVDIGEESENVLIEGNFIHNCTDKGVSVGQSSTISALHNVIVNCDKGIAVKDLSHALIEQNTFYSVGVPVSCFEKNIGLGGGYSLVTNTIFSNSSNSPIEFDEVSDLVVTTSLSDTDSLPKTLNYIGNPLFESPSFNDFTLKLGSIAIESGSDQNGNIIDIGAKPNQFSAEPTLMISAIQYFPQGNPDAEFIIVYNPKAASINLEGFMLAGAVDFIFPQFILGADESVLIAKQTSLVTQYDVVQEFMWTRGRLSNEGEIINLISPYGIIIDQVEYNNKAPWPLNAEGKGDFLRLIDPRLDNHFAESWVNQLNTSTIDPNLQERIISIYPNPTNDLVNIEIQKGSINRIELINVYGQSIYSSKENGCCINIDISNFVSGIYFVRLNGLIAKNTLIVQH